MLCLQAFLCLCCALPKLIQWGFHPLQRPMPTCSSLGFGVIVAGAVIFQKERGVVLLLLGYLSSSDPFLHLCPQVQGSCRAGPSLSWSSRAVWGWRGVGDLAWGCFRAAVIQVLTVW